MFNWLDFVIIGFFIVGAVFGFMQGWRWQLYRIGCVIGAFVLSALFCNVVNRLLASIFKTEVALFMGYAAIFFGVLGVTFFAGALIAKLKMESAKGGKIAGSGLGFVKNVIFCAVLVTGIWILGGAKQRVHLDGSIISTELRINTLNVIYKIPKSFSAKAEKP